MNLVISFPRLTVLVAVSMLLLLVGSSSISFADNPNFIPCNYTVTIDYYTNPTSKGNINGYANGGTETFTYDNVPCSENYFSYEMFAHPEKQAFSIWSVSGGTLSSPVDNGTTLTVRADGTAHITANFVMGLLVPLYIYPTTKDPNTGVTYWQDLINAKNSYPNVPVIAVANPDNGPNSSTPAAVNTAYTQGMTNLTKAGIIVLGYVYTCYGQRPLTGPNTPSECSTRTDSSTGPEDDINTWYNLYGSSLSGIFLDEMNSPGSGKTQSGSYYSSITSYAHNKGLNIVIGNPGTNTSSTYVGTVDIITPYEGSGLPSISGVVGPRTTGGFPATVSSQWGILAYNVVGSSLTQNYVSGLKSDIGWIYVTDASGNPWAVLATYLDTEVSYLSGT